MNAYEVEELREVDEITEETQIGLYYRVSDLETANKTLRKISFLKKRIAENEALATKEHNRIDEWKNKVTDTDKQKILFLEDQLKIYFSTEKEKNDKFKVSTPYGSVTAGKRGLDWKYDEDVAIKALENMGLNEFVNTKIEKALKKADIKKKFVLVGEHLVTEDGEIIDGITATEKPETVVIKVFEDFIK